MVDFHALRTPPDGSREAVSCRRCKGAGSHRHVGAVCVAGGMLGRSVSFRTTAN